MCDPHKNDRLVEVDNRMSYQEPKSRTTSSTTATSDNRTSCQKPKSRTSSSTATSDNRMSCQKPKSRTSPTMATSDNHLSCQKPKSRTTSSTTATSDNRMSCQKPKSRTTSWKSDSTILTILILFIAIISSIGVGLYSVVAEPPNPQDPQPTQWPDQFHSIIVMNNSGVIELVDLWYDWTNGRSLNIIQRQVGSVLYDLE
nr:glycosyl transferase [Tanacetum cinerariifolium]